MTENRFVLDTNAIIYLVTKGNNVPAALQNELNKADLFISIITEIELFAKPSMPIEEEEKLRAFLLERISVIDLNKDVKDETIALRRTTKLKLPDCVVAATSIVLGAILVTGDHHLLDLSFPRLKTQNVF